MNGTQQLTIEFAGEFRSKYLKLFNAGKPIIVDMTEIESIDLSGIQILLALTRESISARKELHITGEVRSEVQDKLVLVGLCESPCSSGEKLEEILKTVC